MSFVSHRDENEQEWSVLSNVLANLTISGFEQSEIDRDNSFQLIRVEGGVLYESIIGCITMWTEIDATKRTWCFLIHD
jgi:hypothetical protein